MCVSIFCSKLNLLIFQNDQHVRIMFQLFFPNANHNMRAVLCAHQLVSCLMEHLKCTKTKGGYCSAGKWKNWGKHVTLLWIMSSELFHSFFHSNQAPAFISLSIQTKNQLKRTGLIRTFSYNEQIFQFQMIIYYINQPGYKKPIL